MDRFLKKWKAATADPPTRTETASASVVNISAPANVSTDVHPPNNSNGSNDKGANASCPGIGRTFQHGWKKFFTWMDFSAELNGTVCTTCTKAVDLKLPLPNDRQAQSARNASVISGFHGWNHAMQSFRNHETSELHRQAILGINNLNNSTVLEKLSEEQAKKMRDGRIALEKIFSTIQYLAKQNMPFRGSGKDENSKFIQTLKLRASDVPQLNTWLNRTGVFKWLHHSNVEEILKMQANTVLKTITAEIKEAKYYAIIVDETSDISRTEQVSLSIRYVVKEDFTIKEAFIGFYYEVGDTKAQTLYAIVRDVLLRLDLEITLLRGQCFDGASNVSGSLSGLQKRLQEDEPRAMFVNCVAHRLNLVVQDALVTISFVRIFIGVVKDLITFVRDSPKRLHFFKSFQQDDSPQLMHFCPTRWCVRIKSLHAIHSNYEALMTFLEETADSRDVDASATAKALGFHRSMESFEYYYTLVMLIEIFERIEILNKQLQKTQSSVNESHDLINELSDNLAVFREEGFSRLWEKAEAGAQKLQVNAPSLPKSRKVPRRYDSNSNSLLCSFPTAEKYFEKLTYEDLDLTLSTLKTRFASQTINFLNQIENFILKKDTSVDDISSFYNINGDQEFDTKRLTLHRDMLIDTMVAKKGLHPISLKEVVDFLVEHRALIKLIPEVSRLIQIVLTIPQSTCTAERSFSALRRLKTYSRSTMKQERLNNIAILNVHKSYTENLNLDVIINVILYVT